MEGGIAFTTNFKNKQRQFFLKNKDYGFVDEQSHFKFEKHPLIPQLQPTGFPGFPINGMVSLAFKFPCICLWGQPGL